MTCPNRESTCPENTTRTKTLAANTARKIKNFLRPCGSLLWSFSFRFLAGVSNETYDSFAAALSTIRKPNRTLRVRKNMKGVSLGLMKACPLSRGCVLKRIRIPQAVQMLNQRLVREYMHKPVKSRLMK